MSNAAQLTERTRALILAQIKANIVAELAAIRTDRNDPSVNTDPPLKYFIFDGAHTYQCPCIFLVVDSFDVPDERVGPNHVNAVVKVYVSAVVEDREAPALTIKAERYQSALFKILHWQTFNDPTHNVKLFSRVKRCEFSPVYTKERAGENMASFRKEVSMELEVKHYENPNV